MHSSISTLHPMDPSIQRNWRLPLEICELILDAAYDRTHWQDSVTLLRTCTLVCKDWRHRAWALLNMRHAEILDTSALRKLSALLSNSPSIGLFVRELSVDAALHDQRSAVPLFPSALRRKLPMLESISVRHSPPPFPAITWSYSGNQISTSCRFLPYAL